MKKLLILPLLLLAACTPAQPPVVPTDMEVGDEAENPPLATCEYEGEQFAEGQSYFDGCNWQACQADGTFVGTKKACEEDEPEAPKEEPAPPRDETSSIDLPVIVFEAAGSIPDEEKQIIRERVLNPFIDYYLESYGDDRKLLSITVKPNYNSVLGYPYSFSYVYSDGVHGGTSISKVNGQIDYWEPDCMGCQFSASYRAKYPEVVEGY